MPKERRLYHSITLSRRGRRGARLAPWKAPPSAPTLIVDAVEDLHEPIVLALGDRHVVSNADHFRSGLRQRVRNEAGQLRPILSGRTEPAVPPAEGHSVLRRAWRPHGWGSDGLAGVG